MDVIGLQRYRQIDTEMFSQSPYCIGKQSNVQRPTSTHKGITLSLGKSCLKPRLARNRPTHVYLITLPQSLKIFSELFASFEESFSHNLIASAVRLILAGFHRLSPCLSCGCIAFFFIWT